VSNDTSETSLPVENVEEELVVEVDVVAAEARWKPGNLLTTKFKVGCAEARIMFDSGSSVNLAAARFVLDN
jgi:hypothetical protein